MKKLISILLCVVMVMGLCGCSVLETHVEAFADEASFSVVEEGHNYAICKHNETGVYYIIYDPSGSYRGGMSVMLNPDGTPYTGR